MMNKHVHLLTLICVLILGFVFIAGCTDTSETEETKELTVAPSDAAANKQILRVGYQPSTHQIAFTTALDKGFYMDELKNTGVSSIVEYQFGSGAPEMQAMMAGELDFAYVGSPPFITAVSNGLGGKIIAGVQTQGSDLVLRNDAPYESPEDLKGLRIATFTAGTIQDTMLRDWLSSHGINPDTEVEISGMGPGDATSAMLAGKVDAVFLPHPSPVTITDAGIGRIIVQSGEMMADHACCVLVASDNMIQNHPEVVAAFLKGHMVGTDYSIEHPEESATIMSAYTGQEEDVIRRSLEVWDGAWVSSPYVVHPSVMQYVDMQEALGYLTQRVDDNQVFDMTFWDSIQ
ncbi:MAG: ABC transporter substrate-binding protein [Methanomicrobiales archaeon]|jgi:NitT/TauT family transport system substrate-binding protein|nr:ABC transporter substrate-binding protein [Methanomicrobiales archaeon]